jgi:predicted RNase H-like HicB family nuclease
MTKRFYPAVLERGAKATFAAWFPDFPGCVAGGKSQEETVEKAENVLAQAVDALAEQGRPLPAPTPIERIALPRGCSLVAYFMVGVAPPDPSERVNVYLPKSLIARADRRAAELGMSRSSFFGLAVTSALTGFLGPGSFRTGLSAPRSKVRRAGGMRAERSPPKKPSV